jgi:ubiquinone/menaquinone biosynthesis C-methylase UbiE
MIWYDYFASFYDSALERLYRPLRSQTLAHATFSSGDRVLDLACGTGQNFEHILEAIGPTGHLVGADYSPGMLARAKARVDQHGWDNVSLVQKDARQLDLEELGSSEGMDGVICTLGLSVIPEWENVFDATLELLKPGGRYTIFDVHAERWVPQTSVVQLFAQAKLERQVWARLEDVADDFTLEFLDASPHIHGGRVFIASGLGKIEGR